MSTCAKQLRVFSFSRSLHSLHNPARAAFSLHTQGQVTVLTCWRSFNVRQMLQSGGLWYLPLPVKGQYAQQRHRKARAQKWHVRHASCSGKSLCLHGTLDSLQNNAMTLLTKGVDVMNQTASLGWDWQWNHRYCRSRFLLDGWGLLLQPGKLSYWQAVMHVLKLNLMCVHIFRHTNKHQDMCLQSLGCTRMQASAASSIVPCANLMRLVNIHEWMYQVYSSCCFLCNCTHICPVCLTSSVL